MSPFLPAFSDPWWVAGRKICVQQQQQQQQQFIGISIIMHGITYKKVLLITKSHFKRGSLITILFEITFVVYNSYNHKQKQQFFYRQWDQYY